MNTSQASIEKMVEAFCSAWKVSVTIDLPFTDTEFDEDDKKHIAAGLQAAMRQSVPDTHVAVPQWISVEERLPEDMQTVAFVVDCPSEPYLHGRVLGGRFRNTDNLFSVPGTSMAASHWVPLPAAPAGQVKEPTQ